MSRVHSPSQSAAYPWAFFVAMAATLLLFFGFHALYSVFPLYIVAIGGSAADTGLATWVFAAAALLTRPLAGVLADRWGSKPVLALGAVLFGSGPLLYALTPGVPLLCGARGVHGVGMALFSTAYQAFIADLLAPGRYGEGLGLANVASVVTMVAAPPFGEWAVREFSFVALFLILGAVGAVGVLVTLALPGQGRGEGSAASSPPAGQAGLWWALRRPGVRAGSLGMGLLGVPFGAFLTFLPLLADARGLGGTGWVFAAFALASSLVQPTAGRVADRWRAGRMALAGLALSGLTATGLAVCGSRWMLVGLAGLFGVGYGAARAGLDACVQGSVGPTLRGSAAAAQYTAHDLLIGLGSWGLGLLACATGYRTMYGVVSVITLMGVAAGGVASVCKHYAGLRNKQGLTTGRFFRDAHNQLHREHREDTQIH